MAVGNLLEGRDMVRKAPLFPAAVSVLLFVLFVFPSSNPLHSQDQSQCVACHTSARKLIEITRAIEKAHPKPGKSKLTKGEG